MIATSILGAEYAGAGFTDVSGFAPAFARLSAFVVESFTAFVAAAMSYVKYEWPSDQ